MSHPNTDANAANAEVALYDRIEGILEGNPDRLGHAGHGGEGFEFGKVSIIRDQYASLYLAIGENRLDPDAEGGIPTSSNIVFGGDKTVKEAYVSAAKFTIQIRAAARTSFIETIAFQLEEELIDSPEVAA